MKPAATLKNLKDKELLRKALANYGDRVLKQYGSLEKIAPVVRKAIESTGDSLDTDYFVKNAKAILSDHFVLLAASTVNCGVAFRMAFEEFNLKPDLPLFLLEAVIQNSTDVVDCILSHKPALLNDMVQGQTYFHWAIDQKSYGVVKAMIPFDKKFGMKESHASNGQGQPVAYALGFNPPRFEAAVPLLEAGAEFTAEALFSLAGDASETAVALIKKYAKDINAYHPKGHTPLHEGVFYDCYTSDFQRTPQLLALGMNPKLKNKKPIKLMDKKIPANKTPKEWAEIMTDLKIKEAKRTRNKMVKKILEEQVEKHRQLVQLLAEA